MDVPLPDGTVVTGVPEGTSRHEVYARVAMAGGGAHFLDPKDIPDPAQGMGTLEKVRAGWGKFLSDTAQGVSQRLGGATTADVEATRRRDAPLMSTTAGQVGYGASAIGHGVATAVIPGAMTLKGATAIGSGLGAAIPTGEMEDPLANVIKGGLFGLGGQAAGKVLSGAPLLKNNLNPTQQALVDEATGKFGLSLPASARTGNQRMAYVESQLATLPGGGSMQAAIRKPQEQLAELVMEQAGHKGPATAETLKLAQQNTQRGYGNIWRGKTLEIDGQLTTDLSNAWAKAQRMLPADKAQVVRNQIDNIWDKSFPTSQTTMGISGDVYQAGLRSELRLAGAGKDNPLGHALNDVKKALDKWANRHVGTSEAEALKQLNREYAIQKQIGGLIPAAEARGGTFTPSGLLPAVGDFPGDVGRLAKIGPMLREPPNSGTATRSLISMGVMGGGPLLASGGSLLPAAAGLAAPAVASRTLSAGPVQRYMAQGFGNMTPRQREMIAAAARGGVLGGPGLLSLQ